MIKRTRFIYGALAFLGVLLMLWQVQEHRSFRERERAELIKRAKAITSTLGSEMRLIRQFNRYIFTERLQPLLNEIVEKELQAVAILNKDGDEVISAGPHIDLESNESKNNLLFGEHWGDKTVTLMANVVDLLGTNVNEMSGTNLNVITSRAALDAMSTNSPPGEFGRPPGSPPGEFGPPPRQDRMERPNNEPAALAGTSAETNSVGATNVLAQGSQPGGRGRRDGFRRFGPPPWMSPEIFHSLSQKQGAHSFVVVMSTLSMDAACSRDLWLRLIVCLLGSVAVAASGLAWRNLTLSSELEVRLVRASELNSRLKEMNLAAAGLAHETRNPLNIIRGLAQMISRQQDASPEVRAKTREILDEADRVTAQLNEFINYSRPREIRRTNVSLGSVVGEVVRALNFDIEEKILRVEVQNNLPTIAADEQLLRQALFNLLLNATQAVERGGEIHVSAEKSNGSQIALEIRDNGPGVPLEQRKEIFKPYFTTNQQGTGLGLAVVQQIVLAHGWEIECTGNEPRGAVFRISHMRSAAQA